MSAMRASAQIFEISEHRAKNRTEVKKGKTHKVSNRTQEREVANMDDLLQKYIEKVDRDQSDFRTDIRESEKRNREDSRELEKRMDNRLDRIEKMIDDQNGKIEKLSGEVSSGLRENKNFMWGITVTIVLSIIASIGVIVATYQSTI